MKSLLDVVSRTQGNTAQGLLPNVPSFSQFRLRSRYSDTPPPSFSSRELCD